MNSRLSMFALVIFIPMIMFGAEIGDEPIVPTPTSTPTPISVPTVLPPPVVIHQPFNCVQVIEANLYNVPGFETPELGSPLVMCNPLITLPDTAPWSFFNNDYTWLNPDGTGGSQIWTKGRYCPAENDYYCVQDYQLCAYPSWGCGDP